VLGWLSDIHTQPITTTNTAAQTQGTRFHDERCMQGCARRVPKKNGLCGYLMCRPGWLGAFPCRLIRVPGTSSVGEVDGTRGRVWRGQLRGGVQGDGRRSKDHRL